MRIAVVGFGYWGPNLVRNFLSDGRAEIAAIVDLDTKKLERARRQYPQLNCTPDLGAVLKDTSVDAIAIATSISTHFELAKMCLEAGKHVLVEKPFTYRSLEAQALIDLATKKERTLMVDHTYLYTAAVRKLRDLIDDGSLGKVQYIDSTRVNLGLVQPDFNVLWDLAPHDISIVNHLIQERPVTVNATGGFSTGNSIENIGYLTLKYSSGFLAHFNCSWASPVKIRNILVGGDKKMAMFNDLEPTEKIRIYDSGYKVQSDEDRRKILVDYRTGDIYIPQLDRSEPLALMVKDFITSTLENKTPVSSAQVGLDVVRVLEAAQISLRENGREVKL